MTACSSTRRAADWGRCSRGRTCAGARAPSGSPISPPCQARILAAGAAATRSGGVLVYSVCTICRAESDAVVDGFPVAPTRTGWASRRLRLAPDTDGTDGFYIVRHAARVSSPPRLDHAVQGPVSLQLVSEPAPKLGPECPGCGEPWLRPTAVPGRYRCVYCLRRYELSVGVPQLR